MTQTNNLKAPTGVSCIPLLDDADCPLCETGFPLLGENHITTQSLGMIPAVRCRKHVKRGDIARYRNYLNYIHTGQKHRNGRYRQTKRQYGDYLYRQDRDKFMADMCQWLASSNTELTHPAAE